MLCDGRIPRFGLGQFGRVAGLHPIIAIGHIALMIGNGQRHCFRFGEFRVVTGIVAVPAVCNVTPMEGESHVRRLRGTQLGLITGLTTSLAGLQILAEIFLRKVRQTEQMPEQAKD